MSENELANYPTFKSIKFEPIPKEVENNQLEGDTNTETEEKKEEASQSVEETQQSVDLPPLPTILSTKITLDCPLNNISFITTYGEEEPSIFLSQEIPPVQQIITTDESIEAVIQTSAQLNIYTEVLNEENAATIQPVATTAIPMNILLEDNKINTIAVDNYNNEGIYNLIIEIEFELDEDLTNYLKNYRIMNLINFTVLNPPEDLTKKYKLQKPKEDPKKKGPPVEAANDKNFISTKAKVEKDNEKLQFCLTFYIPSSKQRLITIEGGYLKPQEDYTWIICFNNVPRKLFLSALSVAKFKDMIFSGVPLMVHFYRKEFKDKKKDWDIVETSFGCSGFDLSSLSTPGTTQYTAQLPLEADQTIPMELFPVPPTTPAKPSKDIKDRKSRVSTTSKSSKSGEKVDASKNSVIPPAVNPYEGSILTIEMDFSKPLYLPLPPPLQSILKPQDVIPNREPIKPIEKTKEATFTIQSEIRSILDIIVNEFIQTQSEYEDPITIEKLQEQVMERIKEKGLPKEFDDRLKRAAIALVNERYKDSELDNTGFIGDIYVYLNQQLMNILNEKFPDSTQPKQPTESDLSISVQQADLLNRYLDLAQESELVQDIPSTNNYYLNRITYLPDHPSLWYEYGVYLLKEGNTDRAAECFRKTLHYDNTHLLCLINYSALLISRKVYDEAEETLLHTLSLENNNVSLECYLLLCVLYDKFKTKSYFEDYFKRTLQTFDNEYSLHYTTGRLLCSLRIYDLAEEAYIRAGYELIGSENIPTIMEYNLCYSIVLYELHKYQEAAKLLEDNDTTNQVAYEYLGYCLMEIDLNLELAITHFVTSMKLCEDKNIPIPLALIYKLNICYQQNGNFDKAKELLIKQCNIMPNSVFWLNIGICCIHLNEIPEAEEALCEANVLNNENGTIWGYLCYLSLLQSPPKFAEAEQALEHAERFGLNNTELLMNLTICYYKNDQYTIAERLVRQLLRYDRNSDVIELGKEILKNLGKNEEAEQLEFEYQQKQEEQQKLEGSEENQENQEIENQENRNTVDENKKINNEEAEGVKNDNENSDSPQLQQKSQVEQSN